jgi:hypothetical protein
MVIWSEPPPKVPLARYRVSAWLRTAVLFLGSLLLQNSIFPSRDMPLPDPPRVRNFWTVCLLNVTLFAVAVGLVLLILVLPNLNPNWRQ